MRFKRTFYVEKNPKEALEFIADFSNLMLWDDSVESVKSLSAEFREGAEFDVCVIFLGNPVVMHYTLTSFNEGKSAELIGIAKKAKALDTIRVQREGSKTKIEYAAEITLIFPYSLVDRLLAIGFAKTIDNAVEGIERALRV